MIADERIKEIWSSIDFDDPIEGRLNRFCRTIEREVNSKDDISLDREYRNGFHAGWNAGVTGDESLLASISNRVGRKSEYSVSYESISTGGADAEGEEIEQLKEQRDELLEALRDTLDFVEHHSNRWDGETETSKHPAEVVDNARSAIVKATSK